MAPDDLEVSGCSRNASLTERRMRSRSILVYKDSTSAVISNK